MPASAASNKLLPVKLLLECKGMLDRGPLLKFRLLLHHTLNTG